MPQLESQNFYKLLEKAGTESVDFPGCYFFFGEEVYLLQQAVQYLKKCVLPEGTEDFNFHSFFASEADISIVRDEIETLPMMSPKRMIVLRESQDLSDKEWAQLEPVIESPVDSSVFVLIASKIDKRKKYFKTLMDKAVCVEFKKPFENQISGWIRHICKTHELTIADDAAQSLHRLVGSQLLEIDAEIKKLKDYIGDRQHIEFEDVAKCVSKRREENVFDLTDSLAQGDRVQSLIHLVHLLDQGQSEIGIVSLVARHMRILLTIKQGLEHGLQGQKLAAFAQVPPYYLPQYVQQAKHWSVKKLENCLLILADTDRALKSSPLSSHIWLENLILKTCTTSPTANYR